MKVHKHIRYLDINSKLTSLTFNKNNVQIPKVEL